uniref:Uncharacterized protein n=1 Tax=Micrurus lemniscatus lemniscatus TaxID=129467 RepID=A0A2D4ICC1_MICLE
MTYSRSCKDCHKSKDPELISNPILYTFLLTTYTLHNYSNSLSLNTCVHYFQFLISNSFILPVLNLSIQVHTLQKYVFTVSNRSTGLQIVLVYFETILVENFGSCLFSGACYHP